MPAAVILTDIDHHPANEYFRRNRVCEFQHIRSRSRWFYQRAQRLALPVVNDVTVSERDLRAVYCRQLPRCVGQGEYLPDAGSQLCADVFFLACEKIQFWGAFHDFIVSILSAARRRIQYAELNRVGRVPYFGRILHHGQLPLSRRVPYFGHVNGIRVEYNAAVRQQLDLD